MTHCKRSFTKLQLQMLHHAYSPVSARLTESRKMYDTMLRAYYLSASYLHTSRDVYKYVNRLPPNCPGYSHQRHSKLFAANSLLEFVAMKIFGPFSKTSIEYRFIFVMTGQRSKLPRAVQVRATTAPQVATIFMERMILFQYIPGLTLLIAGTFRQYIFQRNMPVPADLATDKNFVSHVGKMAD